MHSTFSLWGRHSCFVTKFPKAVCYDHASLGYKVVKKTASLGQVIEGSTETQLLQYTTHETLWPILNYASSQIPG